MATIKARSLGNEPQFWQIKLSLNQLFEEEKITSDTQTGHVPQH